MSTKEKYVIKNTAGMFDLHKGLAMIFVLFIHTMGLFPQLFSEELLNSQWGEYINNISMNHWRFYIMITIFAIIYLIFVETLMPCLLLMSGYGFRKSSIKKSIIKNYKALIIPYIITLLITTVSHFVFHFMFYRNLPGAVIETAKVFVGSALGLPRSVEVANYTLFSNGPNWFLLALFWGLILFNILVSYVPEKYLLWSALGLSCIGWLLGRFGPIPLCITQGLISVLYIYVGYFAKKNKIFIDGPNTKKRKIYIVAVILFEILIHFMGNYFGMAEDAYKFGMISIIGKALISLVGVYAILKLNKFRGKISSIIRFGGHYSIYILCIHTIEMKSFPSYIFAEKWTGSLAMGLFVHSISRIILVFLACYLFVNIKEKVITMIREKKEKAANV